MTIVELSLNSVLNASPMGEKNATLFHCYGRDDRGGWYNSKGTE